jgi:hypothetical protein
VDVRVDNVIINGVATSFQYTVTPIHPGAPVQTIVAAQDDRFAMPADRTSGFFDVLANDDLSLANWAPATRSTVSAAIVDNPKHGYLLRALGNPGILFYFPNPGFSGVDTFSYRVADLDAGRVSNLAQVQITVGVGNTLTNQPPTISSIADLTATAGAASAPIAFSVFDAETDATNLMVTATSANKTLIPNQYITLTGSGANRWVTVTPAAGQTGSDTITLWVSDGQNTTFESFVVTVNAPTVFEDSPWQNPILQYDVNADRIVTPVDVLLIINYLNSSQPPLLRETDLVSPPYLDVSGDQLVSPVDVLLVINYLNERAIIGGEGEVEQSMLYWSPSAASPLLLVLPLAAEYPYPLQKTTVSQAGRFLIMGQSETKVGETQAEVYDEQLINLLSHDAWNASWGMFRHRTMGT